MILFQLRPTEYLFKNYLVYLNLTTLKKKKTNKKNTTRVTSILQMLNSYTLEKDLNTRGNATITEKIGFEVVGGIPAKNFPDDARDELKYD